MTSYQELIKKINTLPPLSNIAVTINEIYQQGIEEMSMIKLIKAIESDAVVTANVLKYVNSPKYGFSKKIASISQAVTLLGAEIVYGLVMNYTIESNIKADLSAYGMTNILFNDMCHLQSQLMLQWFARIDLRHANFLYPLTLIMESGKLIVAKEAKESSYSTVFRRKFAEADNIEDFEIDTFGTTSYYISALLFKHWNLEPLYIEILENLDFEVTKDLSPQMKFYIDSVDVVRTAVNVKNILTNRSIEEAAKKVEDMNLNVEHFKKVAKRVQKKYYENKGIAVGD